ncbi:mechanosensitive ion channel family protein [Butyrivibrio sp. FCS014]|uniref:mechanosensitive ion channel family protein n=1 Tax=Butyrivibrio sp. FCS014 TaxID=1408304 RepID=UPI0004630942|nr:mechanosensitive ion channel domain-containing protein [Butyrivibrio sp. FCS014]
MSGSNDFVFSPYGTNSLETDYLTIIIAAILILIAFAFTKLAFWLIRKRNDSIHIQFSEKLCYVLLTIIGLIVTFDSSGATKTLLQGTAILTAIVGFAAQDSIKDIISGFLISMYRPFNTGDRIELESGISGVVEQLTLGHVILRDYGGMRILVPNSRINTMYVKNYSVNNGVCSIHLTFPVSYNSDVQKVKEVIQQAIVSSSYTLPAVSKNGEHRYSDVLFLEMADSALLFKTCIYYQANGATALEVRDDVTSKVWDALAENGIEIPYNYLNVVMKEGKQA